MPDKNVLDNNVLIEVKDAKMHFPLKKSLNFFGKRQFVKAVDGVSLQIYENETLGLVGESGCGKSTLGRLILQMYRQTHGAVMYKGQLLNTMPKEQMRKLRRDLQIVFQDPYSSLNPRLTVGQMITEGVVAHKIYKKGSEELKAHTLNIMQMCGLQPHMLERYPHQFSGGQRQRICIARALALNPKFIVCDESVSTLDVSIQSQIINLLLDLKENNNLTYLFISHDLSVVRFISDRIAVMYLGNIVELCKTRQLFEHTMHPYTKALLSAVPSIDKKETAQPEILQGDVPSPVDPPSGCKFHPRCKYAKDVCKSVPPPLNEAQSGHFVACHHPL